MYSVSQDYLDKLFSVGSKQRRIRGTVDSIPFTEDDIVAESLTITDKCLNSNDINLGGVFIGTLEMTFLPSFKANVPRGTWKDRCISMSIGLEISEGVWEDVPMKPFYIQEANHSKKGVSITAYDAMVFFDRNLNFDQTSGTLYDFLSSACLACGVSMGMSQAQVEALPNGQEVLGVYPTNDMETWRDFISYCGATAGGYATINRAGGLVLRTWHDTADITIDINHRDINGSWSDFETYYTGLSVVDAESEVTIYYSVEPDTGLTMKLGNNPLLQYGTKETKQRQAMAILNALQSFVYTPYSSLSFIDPAIDLGDVISYTDGLAGEESICCVHKLSYSYRKGVKLTGFGKNPALFGAQSKTDKNIAGLLSRQDENMIVTHTYENTAEMELEDGVPTSIIKLRFATINAKIIKLLSEIQMDVEADPEGDGIVTATAYYYLDNDLLPYSPVTTWDNDGIHLMNLLYWLQNLEGNRAYTWEVALEINGGTARIDKEWIHALLEAQGLVATEEWDGLIEAEDIITAHTGGSMHALGISESIDFEERDIEKIIANDVITAHTGGAMHVGILSENVDVYMTKNIYDIQSADEEYQIGSADGEWYLGSAE